MSRRHRPHYRSVHSFCLTLFLFNVLPALAQDRDDISRGVLLERAQARQAEKEGDLEKALAHSSEAVRQVPQHAFLRYGLARHHALAGHDDEALRHLALAVAAGFTQDLEDTAWDALRADERFQELVAAAAANGKSVHRAELAATIDEADLFPEGIAHDAKTGVFFLSSLTKAKVVRLAKDGTLDDFKPSGADGLYEMTLGMKVDAGRRDLWVVSMAADKGPRRGVGGVFRFDVDSGALRRRHLLPDPAANHFLNDLDVAEDGTVYVTDSHQCRVFRIAPEATELEVFVADSEHNYFNGITLSDDETRLYVSAVEGVFVIDLATRKLTPLKVAAEIAAPHADGLYFSGASLVAVQNASFLNNRIARYFLDPTGLVAERLEVLDAGMRSTRIPYTAVVVGKSLYWHASTILTYIDSGETPEPSMLLKLDL